MLYQPHGNNIAPYFEKFFSLIESREYFKVSERKDINHERGKVIHWRIQNVQVTRKGFEAFLREFFN